MTQIQFYHLTTTPLDQALPKLLEKAHGAGFKTLLVADSEEYIEQLNQLLWTYNPGSFLPHGSTKDGQSEQQPILLSTRMEPLNGANIMVVTHGAIAEKPGDFERILDIFDGNDASAVQGARSRWVNYKTMGYELSYLRQTDSGGWEKKTS